MGAARVLVEAHAHIELLRDSGTVASPLAAALPDWLAADLVEALIELARLSADPVDVRPLLRALPTSAGHAAWEHEANLFRARAAPSWPAMTHTPSPPDDAGREVPAPPLVLDEAHLSVLRRGLGRVDMDIRWTWCLDDEVLRLWRNWTDRLVFEAHLEPHSATTRHVSSLRVHGQDDMAADRAGTLLVSVALTGITFAIGGAKVAHTSLSVIDRPGS